MRRRAARVSAPPHRTGRIALVAILVGAGAWSAAAIPKKSGAAMCGALTAADFTAAGVRGAGKPSANVQDDGASAYCVYAGRSSATGGVELDVFWPAGSTVAEVRGTEQTVMGGRTAAYAKATLSGADDAFVADSMVDGGPPFATIVVRRGDLVFDIGIPAGPRGRAQLLRLSATVLQRLR